MFNKIQRFIQNFMPHKMIYRLTRKFVFLNIHFSRFCEHFRHLREKYNTQHYIDMTENTFKTRYTLHKSSRKHSKNRNQTELSNLIWTLKDTNTNYTLTWSIIDQARPYQPGKRTCNLCLSEKYHILVGSHLINRKSELLNKCPHRRKYLACNHKV